jgi:DNA helicase HerA-like ATPase
MEVQQLLNFGNANGVSVGNLCIGEDFSKTEREILFDINKLRNKRTMIFAQSGFGKTNLMKVMLYHMMGDTAYGKLIFDLNGEYYLKSTSTYGLGDIDQQNIRNNLVVYTDKTVDSRYGGCFTNAGRVLINTHEHLTVGDILNFSAGFSEVMRSFLLYLDEEGISDFIKNIDGYVSDPQLLHKHFPDFFSDKEKSAGKTIAAIRKRVRHLIDEGKGIHSSSSKLIEDVFDHLKKGRTVIIDLSLKDSMDASIISTMIVRKLFEQNKANYTNNDADSVIPVVMVVEEAQNVLSEEFVKSQANPFVRVAKEGRKFGLGIIAVTQRPSAISEEIRTQAENFFVFHMGNSDDIRALVKSNVNYDGVISDFIQRETIPGNLYMVSSNQAFVLPVRVKEFEDLVANRVYADSKFQR